MKVSMDKKYEIRGGEIDKLPVKIYSVEGNFKDTVHGAVLIDGKWRHMTWRENGTVWETRKSEWDLVEVKERKKVEGWVNVYRNNTIGALWSTKDEADVRREDSDYFFACVKITIDCEEGEGL
jgi:hypothetical protein